MRRSLIAIGAAGSGRRPAPARVPRRSPRGGRRDRVGDGARGHAQRRARPDDAHLPSPPCSRSASRRGRRGLRRPGDLQRRRRPAPSDRQGVGEHRRRPQAALRPAAEPRRGGPRRDGLGAGGPDRGRDRPRRLLPRRADPRAGGDVRRHDRLRFARCSRSSSSTPRFDPPRTSCRSRRRSSGSRA